MLTYLCVLSNDDCPQIYEQWCNYLTMAFQKPWTPPTTLPAKLCYYYYGFSPTSNSPSPPHPLVSYCSALCLSRWVCIF